jgi:hypothetical protein
MSSGPGRLVRVGRLEKTEIVGQNFDDTFADNVGFDLPGRLIHADELPKSDRIEDRRGGLSGITGGRSLGICARRRIGG